MKLSLALLFAIFWGVLIAFALQWAGMSSMSGSIIGSAVAGGMCAWIWQNRRKFNAKR